METQDIDKLKKAIENAIEIYPDVIEAVESGDKLTFLEGGGLFLKHGGKLFKFAASIPEIGKELIDLDTEETTEVFNIIADHLGGSDEIKEALLKVAQGAAKLKEGIIELIEIKKK